MEYKNKKFTIYTPIILSLVLILGIFIGSSLNHKKDYKNGHNEVFATSNKLDVILDIIENNYVDSIKKKDLIEKSIPVVLKNLDPHSIYIPARDLNEVRAPLVGNFVGIGVQFNIQDDTVIIVKTIQGGPSEEVGILPGDRIINVNDSVFAGTKITNNDVFKKLKGKKGTKVKVGIKREGESSILDFTITRGIIPIYSIDVAYIIEPEVAYIKIARFSSTTYDEFIKAVRKLRIKGFNKIIIDLRSNTGGYLGAATKLVDEFLEKDKLIVYTQGKNRARREYKATENGLCEKDELVVLIDSYSASASEIFAGAIQDNDRGIIVGRRSFGKGLVQEPIYFKDNSSLRLTIARYYTPTGRSIQKPYEKGTSNYHNDLAIRYRNGEYKAVDSSYFVDSLKFITKGGKTVYGGGGIMPDTFVPVDTSNVTKYLIEIRRKGLIYSFAIKYSDLNRRTLKKYDNFKDLIKYLNTQNLLSKFIKYAQSKNVSKNEKDINISKNVINVQLNAYIVRNYFDNEGYYPIVRELDNVLNKSIEIFDDSKI